MRTLLIAALSEPLTAAECRSSSGRTETPAEELWIIVVFFHRAYLERGHYRLRSQALCSRIVLHGLSEAFAGRQKKLHSRVNRGRASGKADDSICE
jgi:hypothetical protein